MYVLSCFLKSNSDFEDLMFTGNLFHKVGAAKTKACFAVLSIVMSRYFYRVPSILTLPVMSFL